ncbi:CPBP family intramembrane metalloprotease [Cellulophaga sp. 20_2_10]|uniref:CPBP family intramembrane glutamic endopeptidase n=1 Tax=Cellulophaga sp. 20_2_10 TaxID=2942476 RepID=UPI00201B2EE4|nr:CPBP family intramembrane glutamic endopeptidase [Cellulophaga sp. 20_2_10]MCL5244422.1 CPBP family intramembrane metalloprotease [Cellulophaga sp. 20_2_10]
MLKEVYQFLKDPENSKDENTNFTYRITVFIKLLFWGLAIGVGIVIFNSIWEVTGILEPNKHAISKAFEEYSTPVLGLLIVIVAPVFEELIFRGPLGFFKDHKTFRIMLYISIVLFGAVHITNFEITPTVLVLSPFLVAPQLVLGTFASFIRVKFGLGWSMLLHASHNFMLFLPILALKILDIPIE